MKRFKVGDKVTVKEYEGDHVGLSYQSILYNNGPHGVISAGYDDGDGERTYGVDFPKSGRWYILADDLVARKAKTKARGH